MKWSLCRPNPKARRGHRPALLKYKSCSWPHSWDRTSGKNPSQIQRNPRTGPWTKARVGHLHYTAIQTPNFLPVWGGGHMSVFFLCCSLLELKTFSRRTGFLKRLLTKAPASASGSSQLPPASARRRCFLLLKNESLFLPLTLLFVYRRWSVSSPFPSFIPHLQHGAGV